MLAHGLLVGGWYIDTNRLFRDDGWYHIVVSVDTTISSPESDRVKLYVNGVQETSLDSGSSYPSQNYDTLINNTIGGIDWSSG